MGRRVHGNIAVIAALVGLGGVVLPTAAWSSADTTKVVAHQETVVVPASDGGVLPCLGPGGATVPADVTLTFNGVQHTTANGNGFHEFTSFTGQFQAVLADGATASGHVTSANIGNEQSAVDHAMYTELWTGRITSGVGAGTTWTNIVHFTGNVDQSLVRSLFDKTVCH